MAANILIAPRNGLHAFRGGNGLPLADHPPGAPPAPPVPPVLGGVELGARSGNVVPSADAPSVPSRVDHLLKRVCGGAWLAALGLVVPAALNRSSPHMHPARPRSAPAPDLSFGYEGEIRPTSRGG